MKNFEGHRGIKWSREKKNSIRHWSRDSAAILFKIKKETFKNVFLWRGWTNRGETLHVWPPVHEEQKVHTYDIIGHMVWQPYWIYPQTCKKKKHTPLKRSPGRGLQSLIALFVVCLVQKCNGPDMFSWIRYCVAEVWALPSALLTWTSIRTLTRRQVCRLIYFGFEFVLIAHQQRGVR